MKIKDPPKLFRNIFGPNQRGVLQIIFVAKKKQPQTNLPVCRLLWVHNVKWSNPKKIHSNCEVVRFFSLFWGSLTFCILRIPVHFKQLSSRIHPTQNFHTSWWFMKKWSSESSGRKFSTADLRIISQFGLSPELSVQRFSMGFLFAEKKKSRQTSSRVCKEAAWPVTSGVTPPKFNTDPWENDGWKTTFPLGW